MINARTDARAVEGMDKTLEPIRIYEDAGAEMIFPEALREYASPINNQTKKQLKI